MLLILLGTITTITLFILLAYFEPNLGPIKLRLKEIKYLETKHKQKCNLDNIKQNHHKHSNILNEIINVTESDYEDLWDTRANYWLHNWGRADPPSQIQTPPHIQNNINLDQYTKSDNKQTPEQRTQYSTSFKQDSPEPIHEFPISKQRITTQHQINMFMKLRHTIIDSRIFTFLKQQ